MKRILWTVGFLILASLPLAAQDPTDFENGFKPYYSYDETSLDSVDLQTLRLNLHIPLISYPQLGTLPPLSLSIVFTPNTWVEVCFWYINNICNYESPNYNPGPTDFHSNPYVTRDNMLYNGYTEVETDCCSAGVYEAIESSGAIHELGGLTSGIHNFESIDATGIFEDSSTYDILDRNGIRYHSCDEFLSYVVGGMYTCFSGGLGVKDPSGNVITESLNSIHWISSWTDSIGRTIPYPANPSSGCHEYDYPGLSGGTVPITLCTSSVSISTNFNPTHIPYTYDYSGTWNLLSSVTLPNGTAWTFNYDSLGNITSIGTPTGGSISYTWTVAGDPCYCSAFTPMVVSRAVNATTDPTQAKTWTYTAGAADMYGSFPVTVTDPDSNYTVHHFSLIGSAQEYETSTQYYDASSHLLKTVSTDYSWANVDPNFWITGFYNLFDVVPKRTTTTWPNGQASQTCLIYDFSADTGCTGSGSSPENYSSSVPTFYSNDPNACSPCSLIYGKPVIKFEYDYASSAPGSLKRKTVTDYQWLHSTAYLNSNLLEPLYSVNIYDGSGSSAGEATYSYDESSRSASACQTTPCGLLTTTNQYVSSSAYLTSHTNYNSNGMRSASFDPKGNEADYTYDSTGAYPYEIQYPSTGSTTHTEYFSYDSNTGLKLSQTDQNGQTTSYGYDSMRRFTSVSYPDGGSVGYCFRDLSTDTCSPSTTVPSFVFTKKITSSANFVEVGTVDGFGRIIQSQTVVPSSTCSSGYVYVDTTYDNEGRKGSVSNPYCTTSDPTYGVTSYMYDSLDRPCVVIPPSGSTVSGSACPSSAPSDDIFTSYTDSTSLHALCTAVTDQAGKTRKSCTDGLGRMTGVWEDPNTLNYETDYSYNPLDKMTEVLQSSSRERDFSYDWLGRLTTGTNPESGTTNYYYTTSGSSLCAGDASAVCRKTDARSITTTYTYDALNRLTQKAYSDSTPTVSYVFDADSLPSGCSVGSFSYGSYTKPFRTAMCDAAGSEAWSFDKLGRALTDQRTTNSVTKTVTYTYNYDSSLATLAYPSGRTITYTPNVVEQPISAVDTANSINYAVGPTTCPNGQTASGACYTPFGGLAALQNGSSVITTSYYNNRLQPCRISIKSSGTAPTSCADSSNTGNVLDYTYSFDLASVNSPCSTSFGSPTDNGDVASITNNITSSRSQNFCYDALNRITLAQTTSTHSTSPSHCWAESYTYDAWANLTAITPVTGSYNGCTQESGLSLSVNSNNRISTTGFTYDNSGNMTAESSSGYTYDAESQMIQSSVSSTVGYEYDGEGRRMEKTSSGTAYKLYWYDLGNNVLEETDGAGSTSNSSFAEYMYFGAKRIARRDSSSNVDYYFADQLGSARVVTNSGGTVLDDSDFYAYGGERAVSSGSGNVYKFEGKERDAESGLDDFGARYYSSALGRFVSADWSAIPVPVPYANLTNPQTLNLYAIVHDNPETFVDLDGHQGGCGFDAGGSCGHDSSSECSGHNADGAGCQFKKQWDDDHGITRTAQNTAVQVGKDTAQSKGDDAHGKDPASIKPEGSTAAAYGAKLYTYQVVDASGNPVSNVSVQEHVKVLAAENANAVPNPDPVDAPTGKFGDRVGPTSPPGDAHEFLKTEQTFTVYKNGNEYPVSTKFNQYVDVTNRNVTVQVVTVVP